VYSTTSPVAVPNTISPDISAIFPQACAAGSLVPPVKYWYAAITPPMITSARSPMIRSTNTLITARVRWVVCLLA
jgi:hypothetical protein